MALAVPLLSYRICMFTEDVPFLCKPHASHAARKQYCTQAMPYTSHAVRKPCRVQVFCMYSDAVCVQDPNEGDVILTLTYIALTITNSSLTYIN